MIDDVRSWSPAEMARYLTDAGWPAYRGRQLFRALWRQHLSDFDALTVWPQSLRQFARERLRLERATLAEAQEAADGTAKLLVRLGDGQAVETVVLPHRYGWSVCVSSQVGCAMGCRFCASGLFGKVRHLTAGEMLDQVAVANRWLGGRGARVTRVDVMGIGEPLDNYAATVRFVRLLREPDGFGISPRRVTVSTSGLVPRILRLADEGLPVTLAVSLHAPNHALRSRLMPVNRAYPLDRLMEACRTYFRRTRRRLTFEYLLIRDVNDAPALAQELAERLDGLPAHVNLIPWNPVAELPFQPAPPARIRAFQAILEAHGIPCTVRRELGQDIDAACGQLRLHDRAGEGAGTRVPEVEPR